MKHLLLLVVLVSFSALGVTDKCANKVAEFSDLSTELLLLINDTERFSTRVDWFGNDSRFVAFATIDWNKADLKKDREQRGYSFRLSIEDLENRTSVFSASKTDVRSSPGLPKAVGPLPTTEIGILLDGHPLIFDTGKLNDQGIPLIRADLLEEQPHRAGNIGGIPIAGFKAPAGPVYSLASVMDVSSDGLNILTVQGEGDAYVHDAKTGKLRFSIRADLDNQVSRGGRNHLDADFTADGRFVAVTHQYGMGTLWDVGTGDLLAGFKTTDSSFYISPIIQSSPYDNIFVVSSTKELDRSDEEIREHSQIFYEVVEDGVETSVRKINSFININDQLSKSKPKIHWQGWSTPLAFGPGKQVLVGTEVGDAYIFDLTADPSMKRPSAALEKGHDGSAITSVTISPDGQFYATGSMNGIVCLWSTHDKGDNYRIIGQELPVRFLHFSKDGSKLLVQMRDTSDKDGAIDPVVSRAYVVPVELLEKKAKDISE